MKTIASLTLLLLALLTTGCETSSVSVTHTAAYYGEPVGEFGELHTLLGAIEILHAWSSHPLEGVELHVAVFDGAVLRDSFTLVSGPDGLVTFQLDIRAPVRAYTHLQVQARKGDFRPLDPQVALRPTAQIPLPGGDHTVLYECSLLLRMTPQ